MVEVGKESQEFEEYLGDGDIQFQKNPRLNVVSKEVYEERVTKVFHLLWKTLSKSFGPYGAPTIIYNYPYSHVTKDGFTIMKNISMDASETLLDQSICNMMEDVCGRLNYSVGDGTTSAVIATNSIYNQYEKVYKRALRDTFVLPRDIISKYNVLKNEITTRLKDKVVPVNSEDRESLKKNIADVVYISSNGDEVITDFISELYEELGFPAISCELDPEGITRRTLIEGYKYPLMINDKLYINNDEKTCEARNVDVVIFSTRITLEIYKKILIPLNLESQTRQRRLIVAATSYDDNALATIATDLNNEFNKRKEVNMILTTYRAISDHTKKMVSDFAMLMRTTIIDRSMVDNILKYLQSGVPIWSIFAMDQRDIEGLRCVAVRRETAQGKENAALYIKNEDQIPDEFIPLSEQFELVEDHIDVGYCGYAKLGLKDSLFQGFYYIEDRYQAHIKDATEDLETKINKYKKLATFNIEVSQAQERLNNLKLKTGIIGVGGDSELSQKLFKDAVDDSVKAAASAFSYGTVLGCNVNLIQVIHDLKEESEDEVDKILLSILENGFRDVYRTVLSNAFNAHTLSGDIVYERTIEDHMKWVMDTLSVNKSDDGSFCIFDEKLLKSTIEHCIDPVQRSISIHDIIIEYSIRANKVFDISKFNFSDTVINSAQTDEEILKATIDLISLLIVGNQMVITARNNF